MNQEPRNSVRAPVLRRQQLADDIFSFWLKAPPIASSIEPGQFVQVRIIPGTQSLSPLIGDKSCVPGIIQPKPAYVPFLSRPFSIAQQRRDLIRIVLRVVGVGTELLAMSQRGDEWNLLGPLGKAVPVMRHRQVIVVGGGMGIAPLLFLAERTARKNQLVVLLGAKSKDELILRAEFAKLPVRLELATEDGSLGFKGMVTERLARVVATAAKDTVIFACGPWTMLKRVKELGRGLQVYGFWEERMGCGTGICYCCAVRSARGGKYIRFCKEGPVLDLATVAFDEKSGTE